MLEKEQKLLIKQTKPFNLKSFLKLSISSIILSSGLYAVDTIQPVDFEKYPLPKELTAQSRGGDLPDKIAAIDGLGSTIVPPVGKDTDKLKNDAYNKVIYSNVKKLEDNETINDLITNGEITIDENTLNNINDNITTNNNVQAAIVPNVEQVKLTMLPSEWNGLTDFQDGWYYVSYNDIENSNLNLVTTNITELNTAIDDERWQKLKNNMQVGIVGIDENGYYVFASKELLQEPNNLCLSLSNSLKGDLDTEYNEEIFLWWNESGCSLSGVDYTFIKIYDKDSSHNQIFRDSGIKFTLKNFSGDYVNNHILKIYIK